MAEAGSLFIDLIFNSAKFNEGMAKASAAMSAFEKSAKGISKGFTKFGKQLDGIGTSMTNNLTIPILAVGVAVGAAVVKMADYGSSINDMAIRTGFSRESLQELKFAADQTGVSMESIEGSTRKLTKAMGEAAIGGKAAETFKKLGIEVKNADGSLRPANKVFNETIGALSRIPDETTRNVLGMQLLGKSAGDLSPLIAAGTEGLNAYAKEARDAGLVMSEDAVMSADEFGDKMDKLKSQLGHAAMEIGIAFMPMIEQLIGFIQASVIPAIKHAAEWFGSLSDSQKKWVVGIAGALAAIGPLFIAIGKISTGIGALIPMIAKAAGAFSVLGAPITLVVLAVAGAVALIIYNWDTLVEYFTNGEGATMWTNIKDLAVQVWDSLVDLFRSGVAIVSKLWDTFGETISKVFLKNVEFILSAAQTFIGVLSDIFFMLSSALDGDWGSLWDGLVSLLARSMQFMVELMTGGMVLMLKVVQKGMSFVSKDMADGIGSAILSIEKFTTAIGSVASGFIRTNKEGEETNTVITETSAAVETAKENFKELEVGLTGPTEKLRAFKNEMHEIKLSSDNLGVGLDEFGMKISVFDESITGTKSVLSGFGTEFDDVAEGVKVKSMEMSGAMIQMSGLIQSAIESTAVSVGEAVGAMISGTGQIGGVLNAVMSGIADFVGNFGKAMIAASTAAMLAKAALATPASLAAGVALVGLSVVLKNVIASKPMGFAEGGLVMGETLGLIGEGRGTTRSNPEVVAPLDKLMGFMGDGGERRGQVEFIIQGETLRAVLDKNNSSRRFLGNSKGNG